MPSELQTVDDAVRPIPYAEEVRPIEYINPMTHTEAQQATVRIQSYLASAMTAFLQAGAELAKAYEGQAWAALGRGSFEEWCELDFHMSKSKAYDLIRLNRLLEQFPRFTEAVAKIGITKARLLVGNIPYNREDHTFAVTANDLAAQIDDAQELRTDDYRQVLRGDDRALPPVTDHCPHCNYVLTLSRRARILDATPPPPRTAPWQPRVAPPVYVPVSERPEAIERVPYANMDPTTGEVLEDRNVEYELPE